jgi:hypothetical protein
MKVDPKFRLNTDLRGAYCTLGKAHIKKWNKIVIGYRLDTVEQTVQSVQKLVGLYIVQYSLYFNAEP